MKLYQKIAAFVNVINEAKNPKTKWDNELEKLLSMLTDNSMLIYSPMVNISLSNRRTIALKIPVFAGKMVYIEMIIKSDLQYGFDLYIMGGSLGDHVNDYILDFYCKQLNMEA